VNTASRLQSVAEPGTVLVGEATRGAAEAAIAFEPLGEAALKGKALPVAVYRALRVVAERRGSGRNDTLEPPFVGRADELRFLKEQFHATGRDHRAHLVSLVGQAGIGKSRIAWELEKYLDGVVEAVWWHRGRSPSYGEGVTFWALGEMIRRRAGLAEGDGETKTRQAIAAMLARHVPDGDERHWIEPRLLALLGVEEAPPGGREELFAAWRTFFERVAAEGTVALVFEDLQWSDDGLLDFIEHLLDWSRAHPIFVVTLARPELLERRPGWGTDRRGASAMRLEPLSAEAMRALLHGLVPGLPEPVTQRILARADGIPLYAVEIVRMLVADGRVTRADGVYRPTRDLDSVDIPATLHALVAARLDTLPAADRSLLQDAAVLGQSFTMPALAAVTGESPDSLSPRLATLVRRELLAVESDPRAPTRGQHAFVQSMLREVAYSTLPKRVRRARHLAAARYFESLDDDELAAALAMHYVAAYHAAPEGPEGEAAAAQARVALRAAAERAEALGALGQAIDLVRAAREVTRDPREDIALLQRVGLLQGLASRYDDAERSLSEAVERTRAIGDETGVVRSTALLAQTRLSRAQIGRALEALEDAAPEADRLVGRPGSEEALSTYSEMYARAHFRNEQYARSIEWADRALPLAEQLRLDGVIAMALITKASSMVGLGRQREGLALLRGAVLDAQARGQHLAALRGGVNVAAFMMDVDPRASLEWTRNGIAEAQRLGLSAFSTYHAGNLTPAVRMGEWAFVRAATAALQDATTDPSAVQWITDMGDWHGAWQGRDLRGRPEAMLREAEADADPQSLTNALEWLGAAAFANEDFAAATRYGRRLLEHAFAGRYQRLYVGRAALHAGDLELARSIAATLAPSPGGACDADLAALGGGIAAREGRSRDAADDYRSALSHYRELGLRFDVAMTAHDMATLLGPGEPGVLAAATEARGILEELEAAPLLARLERALGGEAAATGTTSPPRTGTPVAVNDRTLP